MFSVFSVHFHRRSSWRLYRGLVRFVVSRLDPTLVTNKLSANLPSAYTAFVQTSGKDVFGICSLELRDEAICLTGILCQSIKEKMEMRAEIIVLVRELDFPKSADELLTTTREERVCCSRI